MKYLALFATLAISMGMVACKHAAAAASTVPVAITIFPTATQTVLPGGSVTFTETVTNTTNTAVTWEVDGNVGGRRHATGLISTSGRLYRSQRQRRHQSVRRDGDRGFQRGFDKNGVDDRFHRASSACHHRPDFRHACGGSDPAIYGDHHVPPNQNVTLGSEWRRRGNSVVGTITQPGSTRRRRCRPAGGPVSITAVLQSDTAEFATCNRNLDVFKFFAAKLLRIFAPWKRPQRPFAARRKCYGRWQGEHHGGNRRHQ